MTFLGNYYDTYEDTYLRIREKSFHETLFATKLLHDHLRTYFHHWEVFGSSWVETIQMAYLSVRLNKMVWELSHLVRKELKLEHAKGHFGAVLTPKFAYRNDKFHVCLACRRQQSRPPLRRHLRPFYICLYLNSSWIMVVPSWIINLYAKLPYKNHKI